MIRKQIFTLGLVMLLLASCGKDYTSKEYLEKVLGNLSQIETASYYEFGEAWSPGDTAASFVFTRFHREYRNPSDTAIGSSFVTLDSMTRSKASFCYDGHMRATFYEEEKGIVIDSFRVKPLPFRPVAAPFYNYVTSIINYALTTGDSIALEMQEQERNVFMRLTINEDEQVEFFGKAFHMEPSPYPYPYGDNTSIYELWIDKETDLPFKVRREMSHDISVSTSLDPEFNKLDINDFRAADFFPPDYEIRQYGYKRTDEEKSALLNGKAPEWTLQSSDNQTVSLADLTSRVVLLQFTSVSCGPCRASVPFLKKIDKEFSSDDLTIVAIECTSKNLNALRTYMYRNQFDYTFLQANKEVIKNYSIGSYPVFFILDEERIIREIIKGYAEGTTDERIRFTVNKLLEQKALIVKRRLS
ncbi:MAG: TlpA disulfide reductase family protein [Bacteroidales bacterium]|jgi:thiol-disulfide isomerase/thioredoxin|nr:TlpA disulfide reductase family protein [Bacteroidales bacterium]